MPLPPNNKIVPDPTLNMSRKITEDPGAPGLQTVTFAVATVNGAETGQIASSQCRHRRRLATGSCASVQSLVPRCRRYPMGARGTHLRNAKQVVTGR